LSISSLILSQCKDRREGVIWDDLGALTTARARESVEDGLVDIQVGYSKVSCSSQA